MAIRVKVPGGEAEEVFDSGVDWDIDRDRELSIYDATYAETGYALAVYAAGGWLRVMRDGPPPKPA